MWWPASGPRSDGPRREKRVKSHLDYRSLMEHRGRLECRRLILTHMSQDMLGRLPLADVEWAEDGLTVVL